MSKILPTELYTKESADSESRTNLEVLIPDPDEETALALIAKNTIQDKEDKDGLATRPD